jgi:prophage tail gpP-like protein
MAFEHIVVSSGGVGRSGWKSVQVTAGFFLGVRKATIHTAAARAGKFPYFPFTPVTITAGGDLLIDGYVLDLMPEIGPRNHEDTVQIVGHHYAYVNNSVKHDTKVWEGKSVLEIAKDMDVFGVGIASAAAAASQIVPYFAARLGSTPWVELMRLLQPRGLTTTGEPDGSITLNDQPTGKHAGSVVEGYNIETGSAIITGRERFSSIECVGQSDGTEDDDLQPEGEATDDAVPINSYKQIIDSALTTPDLCRQRAERERDGAAAFASRAQLTLPGWRDESGTLWTPGWRVAVHAPSLYIEQDMVIEGVTFYQSDSGTITNLSLIGSAAGGGENPEVIGEASHGFYSVRPTSPDAPPLPTSRELKG